MSSDDIIIIDSDETELDTDLDHDEQPPWAAKPAPVAGQKRSREAYLALLNEAKEEMSDLKKPAPPALNATPEQIAAYKEAMYQYEQEVAFKRTCEELQARTYVQDQHERATKLKMEQQLQVSGEIGNFPSFKASFMLKCPPIHAFVAWLDAQTRIREASTEYSVLVPRPDPAGFHFTYSTKPNADHIVVTKITGKIAPLRPETSPHAKKSLHTPLYPPPPPSTHPSASMEAFVQKAARPAPSKAAAKASAAAAPILRVGDQIVAINKLDLRRTVKPLETLLTTDVNTKDEAQWLLRIRAPKPGMKTDDMYVPRPKWTSRYQCSELRKALVLLLIQEKIACKWLAHAKQYFERLSTRIADMCAVSPSASGSGKALESVLTLLQSESSRLETGLVAMPKMTSILPVPDILMEGYVPPPVEDEGEDGVLFVEEEPKKKADTPVDTVF